MVKYSFEDLEVWRKAVDFAHAVIRLAESIETDRKHYRLIEQLEAASTSISSNIAEGKGRYSRKEYAQFLYIARGSLFEVISLLTIFHALKWISANDLEVIRVKGDEVGKMISGLISALKIRPCPS